MLANLWWRLVQFGFRLLYNQMAFTYDWVSWIVSLGEWRCWQRASLAHLPKDKSPFILELAHGTGNLQLDLYAAGYQSIGYDLSPFMGKITAKKLQKHRINPQLTRGKAQELPFASQSFDVVISTFPTNFILEASTLTEVHRILQPDGIFIIVPNGSLTGSGMVKQFLDWLYIITGQHEEMQTWFDFAAHFRQYGFDARGIQQDCENSIVQVIIAQKIP